MSLAVVVGDEQAEPIALIAALTQRTSVTITPSTLEVRPIQTTLASGSTIEIQYTYCRNGSELQALAPKVIVVAFAPTYPLSVHAVNKWAGEIDRMFPRPKVCVVGTRLELLGNRKVLDQMKVEGVHALPPEDCVELASKLRAAAYCEVSAATYTNIATLEASIAKAVIGEADKRPTPELAEDMRAQCIAAGTRQKRTLWIARRDKRTNRIFYFNTETRQPQWTRPKDFDGEEPEMTDAERRAVEADQAVDEETRKRQERDATVMAAYMKEVEAHDSRMRDLEHASDRLTNQIARLQTEADKLRGQEQKNAHERELLESQREEFAGASAKLVKATPEDDAELERELENARARAFQLEAAAAMRMERDFDVQISEAVMRNRSLAARLRSVLQEQLEVQKSGAATQAKRAATRRRLEDGARALARLQQKAVAVEQEKKIVSDRLRATEDGHKRIRGEVQALRGKDADALLSSRDALHQQRKLIEACEELDARVAEMRKRTAAAGTVRSQQECQRLRGEQRTLVQKLAMAEAETARSELLVRKLIIRHEHAITERRLIAEKLNNLAQRRAKLGQRRVGEFEAGLGYSGVTREELERLASSVVHERTARRSTIATESKDVADTLRAKLKLIDDEGTALRAAAREYGEFARARRKETDHEQRKEAEVTEWVVEAFDTLDQTHAAGTMSVAGLCDKARAAVLNDPRLLDVLTSTYAREVVADSNAPDLSSPSRRRLLASSTSATAFDPTVSAAQLNANERSARKSYAALSHQISGQFTTPSTNRSTLY
jgi:hypothetical protein